VLLLDGDCEESIALEQHTESIVGQVGAAVRPRWHKESAGNLFAEPECENLLMNKPAVVVVLMLVVLFVVVCSVCFLLCA